MQIEVQVATNLIELNTYDGEDDMVRRTSSMRQNVPPRIGRDCDRPLDNVSD